MSVNNTRYKIAMIGDASVGKTSIALRFCKEYFVESTEPTIGASFLTRRIMLDEKKCAQFEIWDTAGQERYNSIIPMYLSNSQAIFIVFDLSNMDTYNSLITRWINILKHKIRTDNKFICYLIGNKCDLGTTGILDDQINKIHDILGEYDIQVKYYESSAKTGHNVNGIFMDLANELSKRNDINPLTNNNSFPVNNNGQNKKTCCY